MKYTISDFQKDFPDDDACLDKILELRYGPEATCPRCGKKTKFHRVSGRQQYACQYCGHHIAPCVGTPFEKSSTSLWKWFYAMYLFTSTRHGVPAKELERQLGVTYKTAWRMAHKLRELMNSLNGKDPLSGHVEVDETYIGGRKRGKKIGTGGIGSHISRHGGNKTIVLGILERGGSVRTQVVADVRRKTLEPIIHGQIAQGSTVSTDELASYRHLGKTGYRHHAVNHAQEQYVDGVHHVNSMEGYWSRLKNSIRGTHIHVSRKYLPKYTGEFSFRYDNRKLDTGAMFSRVLSGLLRIH